MILTCSHISYLIKDKVWLYPRKKIYILYIFLLTFPCSSCYSASVFLTPTEDPKTLETIGPATFPGLSGEKWLAHTRYDAERGRASSWRCKFGWLQCSNDFQWLANGFDYGDGMMMVTVWFQSFCGYGAFAVAKGLVYASTAYVNDPDDFLGTKLVLLSCIIGERRKRQGQEISIVIEWTSFRNKLCKCCWSFWMISKRNRAVFGVGDLTIPLYHGIAYLSLSGTNWLCLEVPWVQWSWRARWGDLTVLTNWSTCFWVWKGKWKICVFWSTNLGCLRFKAVSFLCTQEVSHQTSFMVESLVAQGIMPVHAASSMMFSTFSTTKSKIDYETPNSGSLLKICCV